MTKLIRLPGKLGLVCLLVLCGLLAVIVAYSLQIDTGHAHTWVEQHIPAFWSLFGFASTLALLLVASWTGRFGLQVDNELYERTLGGNLNEAEK
ncbi:MAG: hypothetical protein CSA32_05395 [Desulfobulbus propionicus]|nr:MAG: hypothetical protein CSA32_05395 [Desulfobulbus propionicus]